MNARVPTWLIAVTLFSGCMAQAPAYDPDLEGDTFLAGGKADGLIDFVPDLAFDHPASGNVGGDDFDLYKMALLPTDRIELTLTVESGDLEPHLSFLRGTNIYISSESWAREGATLRKTYVIEEAGTHLIAARAYRGEGRGDYALEARCLAGPCAGDVPPPTGDLEADEVAGCIDAARRCAFARLPTYDGRLGEAGAALLVQECLDEASLTVGSACAGACEWDDPYGDDDAPQLCAAIRGALPFYADQEASCHSVLDRCIDACTEAGSDRSSALGALADASLCWTSGRNGNCDYFARAHQSCGGTTLPDSSAECERLCESTYGAFVDNLSGICGEDADCGGLCDVDVGAATAHCRAEAPEDPECIRDQLDGAGAWTCLDQIESDL